MALPYNADNKLVGKGRLFFQLDGETGYLDLGDVPKFELALEIERIEDFSSRSGVQEKDLDVIKTKKVTSSFELKEFAAENLNLAFLGDGIQSGSQSASFLDEVATTPVSDRFVELGYNQVTLLKVTHGTVTGGPFVVGETITGGTSSETAEVKWVGATFLEVVDASGDFTDGETITGGTSSASAAITETETLKDAVVVDASPTPATRYVAGTDYTLDSQGGLLRKLSGGSIGATCYVSGDYPALTTKSIRALVNSECQGKLLFVGDPDIGPKLQITGWKVNLTIDGAMGLISEEVTSFAMSAEFLSDADNHPNEPFFRSTEIF